MAAREMGKGASVFPFKKDDESGVPLWVQLRNRVVYLINNGYYKPGDQLPTIHVMASELSINYNTVSKVYTSLVNDGYIATKRGCGAFVLDYDREGAAEQKDAVDAALDDCIAACTDLGLSLKDIEQAMKTRIRKREQEGGA